MKKLKLFMAAFALILGWSNAWAQMTDVTTTYITNAGFETDEAASDLTGGSTQNTPTGWTISPSPLSNTQWGTANSSTKIQGNSTSQAPSAGDKYFYFRDNWNTDQNISVSQASKAELPAGNYIIYVDVFTYSSNATQPVYSFTVKNGETSIVNGTITANAKEWRSYYYHFKLDAAATLTFSANMTPKAAASGCHDWMLLDNIRLLKANSPQTPIANNTTDLYFKNEKTGQYLSAGHSWGTHATVDNYGYEVTATVSEGVYQLKTQQYNKYLGGLYMDAGAVDWLFLGTGESGKYYLTQDGYNYMTSNGAGAELVNVTSPTDASVWTIISKADRKTALSSATIDVPGDATFLIADANFSRNTTKSVWNGTSKTSDDKTNLNLGGGNNDNFCAESFHAHFSIHQNLTGMPTGVYGLTAQGFYRQDGSGADLPYFYLNTEKETFPAKTGSENSMSDASTSFSAGLYTTEPIYVRVEDGNIELGAKLEDNFDLWCIWDNFQLKYYGNVTIAAVKMKASVDAYNAAMTEAQAFTEASMWADGWTALQSAITTNTLDLNDPSLTEEALTTATSNLVTANAAATASVNSKTTYNTAVTTIDGGTNVNLTSLIVNPSFESDFTGWTNTGSMSIQTNTSFDKTGSKYVEFWQPNGTKGVSQTIGALPAGVYTLSLRALARSVTSAKLFANSNEQAITIEDKQNEYSLTFEIADKASINIGFEGVGTGASGSWMALDNFRLTYVGTINDLTYTKATGKMGTDKSAAQDAAEATFLANKTLANYNALIAAIAEAEASVANYAKLKDVIDKANVVIEKTNFVTSAATTTFQSAITTATNGWTDVTFTDAECTAQITTLGSGVSGWHANATGAAGVYMTSTWSKTNENWWNAPYINTWSTEGDNDGSGFSVPFFEYFADADKNLPANTFTATLNGLDNGFYEVEIWARAQRRSDADFNGDNTMITMSVNGGDAVSIMSGQSTVGSGTSVMRLGRYKAYGEVTDGTLTLSIDVKLGSNVHWLSWRDITYTKLPDNVSATIGSNGFTTFASPYALDLTAATQTANSFKAYRASAVNDETVTFKDDVNQTVVANTGILLQGTANAVVTIPVVASGSALADNALQVNVAGTTFAAAANTTYYGMNKGSDPLTFGTFNPSSVAIPANKAYLSLTSNAARSIRVVFGDDITGIENVEAAAEAVQKEGKFFKDGKLFIFKNGKKYNAAGAQIK